MKNLPGWRNRQTRRTQDPVGEIPCGFKSRPGHQSKMKEKLIKILKEVKKVVLLSGAGLSAESGIPTFRGKDGLWNKFNPTELATPEAFFQNPQLVWKWYIWRMHLIANSNPNPAHYAISKMEKVFPHFIHVTQNVDGLHREAGNRKFLELHGYIFDGKCRYCGALYPEKEFSVIFPLSSREFLKKISEEKLKEDVFRKIDGGELPICPKCGEVVGPGVVWFGESLPENVLEKAILFSENCELFITVGTSAVVQPAASLPLIAKKRGALLVEINPEETPISKYCDFTFRESASSVLPDLISE